MLKRVEVHFLETGAHLAKARVLDKRKFWAWSRRGIERKAQRNAKLLMRRHDLPHVGVVYLA